MPEFDALVLPPRRPTLDGTTIGGVSLTERTVLALHQAGVERIVVSTERIDGPRLVRRLASHKVPIELAEASASNVRHGHAALVVTTDAIFEPAAIAALVSKAEERPDRVTLATGALAAILAYMPPMLVDRARTFASVRSAIWSFYRQRLAVRVDVDPRFCRPVPVDGRTWDLEADELRWRLGPESWYARPITTLSRPILQVCLRLRLPATAVTGLGLALALLAAIEIAQGTASGHTLGALCCLASIVTAFVGRDMERATMTPAPASGRPSRASDDNDVVHGDC